MSDTDPSSSSAVANPPPAISAPTTAFSLMFASNIQAAAINNTNSSNGTSTSTSTSASTTTSTSTSASTSELTPPTSAEDPPFTDPSDVEDGEIVDDENIPSQPIEHPLETAWTFWYNAPQKQSSEEWQSNVKPVMDVNTVEEFWRLYNVLKAPSLLVNGSNYHMFRAGISPEWEDPVNKSGGKWVFTIPQMRTRPDEYAHVVDQTWMETLLALIGETFDFSDEICGAVISPRPKETRVALWTRTASDAHACTRIGHAFKAQIHATSSIGYLVHRDCMKRGSSFRNAPRYTV